VGAGAARAEENVRELLLKSEINEDLGLFFLAGDHIHRLTHLRAETT
jgi:hypothetical protein